MKKTLRILIIEDSENDAVLLLRQLRNTGFSPDYEIVSTLDEVMPALDNPDWQIIVCDYVLPEFRGPDILRIIQERQIDIPCIIVSGEIDEETAVAAMKAGARDYIMKDNLRRLGPVIERELQEAEIRREKRATEEELKESQEQMAYSLLEGQEAERKRIARELHDDTAQSLSVIRLELDALISKGTINSPSALEKLQSLRDVVDRTTEDVRRYSHELHPAVLDQLGLRAALEQLVGEIKGRACLEVQLDVQGRERNLAGNTGLVLFRIAQESLNNIWKHARASEAVVLLDFSEDRVTLSITDNGQGFNVKQESLAAVKRGSLGLLGMRERAHLIKTYFHLSSKPKHGTAVTVEVKT
jgi:signal transduction histidine kinase